MLDQLTHLQYRTIITTIDYVSKWVEIKATQENNSYTTTKFLFEYIFMRYSLPIEIVSDRGKHFLNEVIENLLDKFMVLQKKFVISGFWHAVVTFFAICGNWLFLVVLGIYCG